MSGDAPFIPSQNSGDAEGARLRRRTFLSRSRLWPHLISDAYVASVRAIGMRGATGDFIGRIRKRGGLRPTATEKRRRHAWSWLSPAGAEFHEDDSPAEWGPHVSVLAISKRRRKTGQRTPHGRHRARDGEHARAPVSLTGQPHMSASLGRNRHAVLPYPRGPPVSDRFLWLGWRDRVNGPKGKKSTQVQFHLEQRWSGFLHEDVEEDVCTSCHATAAGKCG